jgi:two-component system response regulator PilR (NtrC family)
MKNEKRARILIVDDERTLCETLSEVLKEEGYETELAFDGDEAISKIEINKFDLIFCDLRMPRVDGLKVLEKVEGIAPETYFIVMTAYHSMKTTIEALKLGAYDYVVKPLVFDDVLLKLKRLLAFKNLSVEDRVTNRSVTEQFSLDNLLGQGREMKAIYSLIQKVAPTGETILITGEIGVGKGRLAKAIHYVSEEVDNPFWDIRCSGVREKQIEASLFGEEGIFTKNKRGTLYLSEISELTPRLQTKLLEVLSKKEEGETRLIVSATKDLSEDLLYRVNVIEIKVPPLRARRGDIPFLIKYFVRTFAEEFGKNVRFVEEDMVEALMNYPWRGNVRELENFLERAILLCDPAESFLKIQDLSVRSIN